MKRGTRVGWLTVYILLWRKSSPICRTESYENLDHGQSDQAKLVQKYGGEREYLEQLQ